MNQTRNLYLDSTLEQINDLELELERQEHFIYDPYNCLPVEILSSINEED